MIRSFFVGLLALCVGSSNVIAQESKDKEKPTTVTPSPRTADWWQKRHEKFLEQSKVGGIQVAFLGDSITQGWEGAGKDAWAKYFAPLKAGNYGIGGDQTQHVLWRITEGKELVGINPKVAVLMIGTNNFGSHSPEQIAQGVEAIVKELRSQKPKIKVLVLGIFPRSKGRFTSDSITKKDLHPKSEATNKLISKFADDKHVFYMDIGETFLEKDGGMSKKVMPDYLHLSPEGYERWAKAIESKVKELLK
jgi:lysophospholipase L1-like esterase